MVVVVGFDPTMEEEEEEGGRSSSTRPRLGIEEGRMDGSRDLGHLARRSRTSRGRRVVGTERRRRKTSWGSRIADRGELGGEVGSWSGEGRVAEGSLRKGTKKRSDEDGWRSSRVVVVEEVEEGNDRRRRREGRKVRRRRVFVASGRPGVRSRVPRECRGEEQGLKNLILQIRS